MSGTAMWCLACGDKMQLVQAERAEALLVAGYEHHTWQCSPCGQSERRLVFRPSEAPATAHPPASDPSGPVAPDPPELVEHKPKLGTWERAVDKLRDRQRLLAEKVTVAGGRDREPAARPRSPAESAWPSSPSRLKPVSWRSRIKPAASPTGIMARLAEKLRNRQADAARPVPTAKDSGDLARFEEVWEGRSYAVPASRLAAASSQLPPLPRLLSLVPIEAAGQTSCPAVRALAMLSGRGSARRD